MEQEPETLKEPTTDTMVVVPWGLVCGKWWGSKKQRPIICIHGWQDNAGTFDTLIPLLSSKFSYFCIDLPGHGRSSCHPEGMPYYLIWDGVILLRRMMKHYGWEKISVMGHSLGSLIGFMFAAVFPDEIDLLIGLDAIAPTFDLRGKYSVICDVGKNIDKFLYYSEVKSSKDPVENYEAMIDTTYEGHNRKLTRKSCEILMIRGMNACGDGTYSFARDNRVKVGWISYLSGDYVKRCGNKIKCRYLNIKATPVDEDTWPIYKNMLDIIESSSSDFNVAFVEGPHHVHLNDPELVAPSINEFLSKEKNS